MDEQEVIVSLLPCPPSWHLSSHSTCVSLNRSRLARAVDVGRRSMDADDGEMRRRRRRRRRRRDVHALFHSERSEASARCPLALASQCNRMHALRAQNKVIPAPAPRRPKSPSPLPKI
eukprot:2017486-Pyramimonas_sp.AAC.1